MFRHKNEIRFHPPSGRVEPQRGEGGPQETAADSISSAKCLDNENANAELAAALPGRYRVRPSLREGKDV